jgi:crotonobetainyl-CoA:carnitine CoA-transferase CaiB-like acyl-CoA transferase
MGGMPDAPDFASGPLVGVRVIDLSRVLAGPYVGRILADFGADVIKVEPPEGDLSRLIAPKHDRGMSALFTFANAGKRSISMNLKNPAARDLVLDLVRRADVVVENFRPGVVERLGLGWKAIEAANPRAVLLSINGFGADSSWRERRAFAPIMHAVTGILHDQAQYSGQAVAQRNEAHADTVSALHGAVAILAALRVAEATGRGQHIEVPMFDAVLTTYNQTGTALLDPPDDRDMNPVYDAGEHGIIAVAGPTQHIWRSVIAAHSELADPTPPGADLPTKARLRHAALEAWMAKRDSREALFAALETAGLACAPVVSLREALLGPLATERSLLEHVDDRRGGTRPVVRPAARLSAAQNRVRGPAPRRGEHNAEVLRELLGVGDDEVAAFERAGVLAPPGSASAP